MPNEVKKTDYVQCAPQDAARMRIPLYKHPHRLALEHAAEQYGLTLEITDTEAIVSSGRCRLGEYFMAVPTHGGEMFEKEK